MGWGGGDGGGGGGRSPRGGPGAQPPAKIFWDESFGFSLSLSPLTSKWGVHYLFCNSELPRNDLCLWLFPLLMCGLGVKDLLHPLL